MKISALVTLYFPDFQVVDNVSKLIDQVDSVVLLDNSPPYFQSPDFTLLNVVYIRCNSNLGLSAAFNKGLQEPSIIDSDFIIFFDQDSSIQPEHISLLMRDYYSLSRKYRVGCIGPFYAELNSNSLVSNKDSVLLENGAYSVKSLITSSLLVSSSVLKEVGFWSESIFLDYADWDLVWKIRSKDYLAVSTSNVVLQHKIGEDSFTFLGLPFPVYPPVREYYRIRDSLKLSFRRYVPLKYRLKFVYTWFIEPFIYLSFFPKRKRRICFILKAFRDGLLFKDGPFSKS